MRLCATVLVCIAAAVIAVFGATPALASSGQLSIFQADREAVLSGPSSSAAAVGEIGSLGADVLKAQILWRDVAPATRPADPSDPASYNWSAFDTAVRNTRAAGMRPYLALGAKAPSWASKRCRGAPAGTCRPSYDLFRQFALAAGRHFVGDLSVDMWSFWNEPNLATWLNPQRSRRGTPLAPSIYRRLYVSGRRGLGEAGRDNDTILLGELAPLGSRRPGLARGIMPLAFIREMACVSRHYRGFSRRRRRARGCSRARIRTSGFAIHPYTARLGRRSRRRDTATLSDLGRLKRTLDRTRRRLGTGRLGIFITEVGFQSRPPDPYQHSLATVARYLDESEYIAYRSPRIKSASQYILFDDPIGRGPGRFSGFQQGLRFANSGDFVPSFGARKPMVYDAYRMPFFVKVRRRHARGRVEFFGGVRAKRLADSFVTLDSALPGRPFKRLRTIKLNDRGYFRRVIKLSRATRRTYRLTSTETTQVRKKRAVKR